MIADKKYIDNLRNISGMRIDHTLEAYILDEYGDEPFPNIRSEQDLYEQIRKHVKKYMEGNLSVKIKTPEERWKEQREYLFDLYLRSEKRLHDLSEHLYQLEKIMKAHEIDIQNEELDF